jgi:hypothetical protein
MSQQPKHDIWTHRFSGTKYQKIKARESQNWGTSLMASRIARTGKEIRHLTQYPKQKTDTELNQN